MWHWLTEDMAQDRRTVKNSFTEEIIGGISAARDSEAYGAIITDFDDLVGAAGNGIGMCKLLVVGIKSIFTCMICFRLSAFLCKFTAAAFYAIQDFQPRVNSCDRG